MLIWSGLRENNHNSGDEISALLSLFTPICYATILYLYENYTYDKYGYYLTCCMAVQP